MSNKIRLRGKSAQYWISTYNNRIVAATWLMFFIGILTAAAPFLVKLNNNIPVLNISVISAVASEISSDYYGIYTALSIIVSLCFMIPSIMSMAGKPQMLLTGVLLLLADIGLFAYFISKYNIISDEVFMFVVAITFRVMFLNILFKGYRDYKFRTILFNQMAEADRQYDKELETGIKYCENEDAPSDN